MHALLRRPRTLLALSTLTLSAAATVTSRRMASNPAPADAPTPASTSTSTSTATPSTPRRYTPTAPTWPYTPRDFARSNAHPDTAFYATPRFVTHIDDAAIAALTAYYERELPRRGVLLDLCTSWTSHYPAAVEAAVARDEVRVVGLGMNAAELRANALLGVRVVQDLNAELEPGAGEVVLRLGEGGKEDSEAEEEEQDALLDAATCVVSIDYLVRPREVLAAVRKRMRVGGRVHLAISNRAFWEKATRAWCERSEAQRLEMVGDFLWFAGWREIEVVVVTDGRGGGAEGVAGRQPGLLGMLGFGGSDPLWIVRGTKVQEGGVDDEA